MAWPPTLEQLRDDLAMHEDETEDDAALTRRLDAAVAMVQRTRSDAFLADDCGDLVEPATYSVKGEREADSLELGTLMLAARWHARRRSPDLVLWMAETGTVRIPGMDADIARLLRLGPHSPPRVG